MNTNLTTLTMEELRNLCKQQQELIDHKRAAHAKNMRKYRDSHKGAVKEVNRKHYLKTKETLAEKRRLKREVEARSKVEELLSPPAIRTLN